MAPAGVLSADVQLVFDRTGVSLLLSNACSCSVPGTAVAQCHELHVVLVPVVQLVQSVETLTQKDMCCNVPASCCASMPVCSAIADMLRACTPAGLRAALSYCPLN